MSLDYVYEHAADLGAMRLGDGPKARLRFELQTAKQAMRERKQPPTGNPMHPHHTLRHKRAH